MTIKSKIFLAVSLTAFAVSLTGALWGLFLPIGAIIFGQFMIFAVLEKESTLFDEEQHLRLCLVERDVDSSRSSSHAQQNISLCSSPVR
jgi:hypothetical protein